MITEVAGRTGFINIAGEYLPIYNFSFSSTENSPVRYLSDSGNYPVRRKGTLRSSLSFSASNYFYTFPATEFTTTFGLNTGATLKFVDFVGHVDSYEHTFDFSPKASPSYSWTVSLTGTRLPKQFGTVSEEDINTIFCTDKACGPLETTDSTLYSGEVWHVSRATLSTTIRRPERYLSDSNNRIASREGLFDTVLSLAIEGDFDYWLDLIEDDDATFDYRINYGSQYIDALNMRCLSLENLVADLSTSKLVSATVKLGANYG